MAFHLPQTGFYLHRRLRAGLCFPYSRRFRPFIILPRSPVLLCQNGAPSGFGCEADHVYAEQGDRPVLLWIPACAKMTVEERLRKAGMGVVPSSAVTCGGERNRAGKQTRIGRGGERNHEGRKLSAGIVTAKTVRGSTRRRVALLSLSAVFANGADRPL